MNFLGGGHSKSRILKLKPSEIMSSRAYSTSVCFDAVQVLALIGFVISITLVCTQNVREELEIRGGVVDGMSRFGV